MSLPSKPAWRERTSETRFLGENKALCQPGAHEMRTVTVMGSFSAFSASGRSCGAAQCGELRALKSEKRTVLLQGAGGVAGHAARVSGRGVARARRTRAAHACPCGRTCLQVLKHDLAAPDADLQRLCVQALHPRAELRVEHLSHLGLEHGGFTWQAAALRGRCVRCTQRRAGAPGFVGFAALGSAAPRSSGTLERYSCAAAVRISEGCAV